MTHAPDLVIDLPVSQLVHFIAARFAEAGIASPKSEAEWLVAGILGGNRSSLFLERGRKLSRGQQEQLKNFFIRRLQREPLQYIFGICEFYGYEFRVNTSVLIPRPETELLVEKVIALMRPSAQARIADLGTGSGCIAVTLAKELPGVRLLAADVSAEALQVAGENAARQGVADRIEFRRVGMCEASVLETFDAVVSNPPYVLVAERSQLQPEIREFEPEQALYIEGDGLKFYHCIVKFCERHLKHGGWVACEMASQRSAAITQLFENFNFTNVEIIRDYAGLERHLVAQRAKRMEHDAKRIASR